VNTFFANTQEKKIVAQTDISKIILFPG